MILTRICPRVLEPDLGLAFCFPLEPREPRKSDVAVFEIILPGHASPRHLGCGLPRASLCTWGSGGSGNPGILEKLGGLRDLGDMVTWGRQGLLVLWVNWGAKYCRGI